MTQGSDKPGGNIIGIRFTNVYIQNGGRAIFSVISVNIKTV